MPTISALGTSARADDHLPAMTSSTIRDADLLMAATTTLKLSEAKQNVAAEDAAPQFAKSQCLGHAADDILKYMYEVNNHMAEFGEFIQAQKNEDKPLYNWAKYTKYDAASYAVTRLDEAAARLEPVHLPRDDIKACLGKATQFSLCISRVVVAAMGAMGEKFDTCIDEIEDSDLSVEGKASAKAFVTGELKELVTHCSRTTSRVYSALDLLRESLFVDESSRDLDFASIKKLMYDSEDRLRASHKTSVWTTIALVLGTVALVVTGLVAAHLSGPVGFDLALKSETYGNGMFTQVVDLVQRTQAVTNLTNDIYSIKLQDIDRRYKELEVISEAHGSRIDNLVESLGPTNEEGTYYTSMRNPDQEIPSKVNRHIRKLSDSSNRDLVRLHQEMENMRKNINRMDTRLTERLDKVDRTG